MKYLCLVYDDEVQVAAMAKDEADRFREEFNAFTEDIHRSGHYVACAPLHPVRSATTLRIRNGKLSTTDGPFAETREQLGGFFLIEARDLNEAIQVASRIPSVRTGSIEIRPVVELGEDIVERRTPG